VKPGVIRLRPHHLLCLLAFTGEGYSPAFVEKAKRLQRAFLEKTAAVEVVRGLDDLCNGCPELRNECASASVPDGIFKLDSDALRFLRLEPGRHTAGGLLRRIRDVFDLERCYAVCADCSWLPRMNCPQVILNRLNGLRLDEGDET
jgi:hypothetical protein